MLSSKQLRYTAFANSFKPVATVIAALIVAIVAAGCGGGSSDSQDSGSSEVTLMAYSGIFQDNYQKAVVEPFMEKNPDIKVNYQPSESSSNTLAQLRSQKNNPSVDVAIMDVSIAATANEEGIFQKLDPQLVGSLDQLKPDAKTPDNYGPAVTFDNLSLIYNTETVKEEPTSWNSLWDPEYANDVIVTAPPDIQGLAMTIITDKMEGANYKDTIDPAIARLNELAPAVQTWDPKPDQYTIVSAGNAALAIGWNARSQLYADQSNGTMAVSLPEEGSIFQKNTINLTKGSSNSEAAQKFIDYALSPEAQRKFSETMYYAPVNKEVDLSQDVLSRTAAAEDYKIIPVDWNYMTGVQDEWLERWRKEILSAG